MNKKEPVLIVLAAGIGSRFGGLKQVTPIDDFGHSIIDFSLYDAKRAGFKKVIFVIKHNIEEEFVQLVGSRVEKYMEVEYVFQETDILPSDCHLPAGRTKPWGTGHAVLCCADYIDGPFAVINSDDFYGPTAYSSLYDFLTGEHEENEHAIVSYLLRNTVTETGTVSRGICSSNDGYLTDVVERLKIRKAGEDAEFTEDNGVSWTHLDGDSLVSMNCWAFSGSMMEDVKSGFPEWFRGNLTVNPLKGEYFLPFVVSNAIKSGRAKVRILSCAETWYGITYREDLDSVKDAIKVMRDRGIYPEKLLD